jgi:hypothetical protein
MVVRGVILEITFAVHKIQFGLSVQITYNALHNWQFHFSYYKSTQVYQGSTISFSIFLYQGDLFGIHIIFHNSELTGKND